MISQGKIKKYFERCKEQEEYPTVTGLALYLGMEGRQELEAAGREETALGAMVRRACSQIEEANLQAVYSKDTAASAKFILQNEFGYSDKREVELPGVICVNLVDSGDEDGG